jgi:tripartite-type tricarboxylate transporter receptor subunit TctC
MFAPTVKGKIFVHGGVAVLVASWLALGAIATAQTLPQQTLPQQTWPTRTVRIVIPLAAGGGGDVFTRLLANELQTKYGQPFVVENRPGGALNTGARACAESPPDGYTLCVLPSDPIVFNQFLFRRLPFNPEKDFEPITNLFFNLEALVVNAELKVKTIPDVVALAKAKPGTLSYGTFSFVAQQFMEKLWKKHDLDIVRVPFRSGNEVVNAVMSGTSPIALLGLSNMLSQIRGGYINGVALSAKARSPLFPEMPTLVEVTGENYLTTWFGFFAPAGTPRPIIEQIHADVVQITGDPAFRQKNYVERAIEYGVNTPEQFAKFIVHARAEAEKLVKESNAQPQ